MKTKITSADFLAGLLLLAICLLNYFVIIPREVQGEIQRGLPPDFFPKFSMAWVGVFAIFLMAKSLFVKVDALQSGEPFIKRKEGRKGVVLAIVGTIVYLILCSLISYIPATIVALIILMRLFGERRWIMLVTVSVVITFAIYVLFAKVMFVQLPQCIFLD